MGPVLLFKSGRVIAGSRRAGIIPPAAMIAQVRRNQQMTATALDVCDS